MDYKKFLSGINLELNKQLRIQEDFTDQLSTAMAKKQSVWDAEEEQEKAAKNAAQTASQSPDQTTSQQNSKPEDSGRTTTPLIFFKDKTTYTLQQFLNVRNLILYDLGRPKKLPEIKYTPQQDKEQQTAEHRSRQTAATLKPLEVKFLEWIKREANNGPKSDIDSFLRKQDGTFNEDGIKQLRQMFLTYVGSQYNARVVKNPKNENPVLAKAIETFGQKYELNTPQTKGQTVAIGLHAPSPGTADQIKQNVLNGIAFGGGYEGNTPLKNGQIAQWWKEVQPYLDRFTDTKKALNFGIQYAGFKKGIEGVIDPTIALQQEQSINNSFIQKLRSQLLA
jgi:hypothetical protein